MNVFVVTSQISRNVSLTCDGRTDMTARGAETSSVRNITSPETLQEGKSLVADNKQENLNSKATNTNISSYFSS